MRQNPGQHPLVRDARATMIVFLTRLGVIKTIPIGVRQLGVLRVVHRHFVGKQVLSSPPASDPFQRKLFAQTDFAHMLR